MTEQIRIKDLKPHTREFFTDLLRELAESGGELTLFDVISMTRAYPLLPPGTVYEPGMTWAVVAPMLKR